MHKACPPSWKKHTHNTHTIHTQYTHIHTDIFQKPCILIPTAFTTRKCQEFIPQPIKLMLVKSLVFPHLHYCAALFLDMTVELCGKMQRCKNAALRFALGLRKFDHITSSYAACNILEYTARRDFLCVCLLASILRVSEPRYLADKFSFWQVDLPGLKRRPALDLETHCTNYLLHSFTFESVRLWNKLPPGLRSLYTHVRFKEALMKYALSTASS